MTTDAQARQMPAPHRIAHPRHPHTQQLRRPSTIQQRLIQQRPTPLHHTASTVAHRCSFHRSHQQLHSYVEPEAKTPPDKSEKTRLSGLLTLSSPKRTRNFESALLGAVDHAATGREDGKPAIEFAALPGGASAMLTTTTTPGRRVGPAHGKNTSPTGFEATRRGGGDRQRATTRAAVSDRLRAETDY